MFIEWQDVISMRGAANLSAIDTDIANEILGYVNGYFKVSEWGGESSSRLRLARLYLAAHNASLVYQGVASSGGTVILESVGGVTRQYASFSPMGSDPLLDSTTWGKLLRQLGKTVARGPQVL